LRHASSPARTEPRGRGCVCQDSVSSRRRNLVLVTKSPPPAFVVTSSTVSCSLCLHFSSYRLSPCLDYFPRCVSTNTRGTLPSQWQTLVLAITALTAFLLRRQRLVLIAFSVWTANWIAAFTFTVRLPAISAMFLSAPNCSRSHFISSLPPINPDCFLPGPPHSARNHVYVALHHAALRQPGKDVGGLQVNLKR
jgi:hypothetical protein